MNALNRLIEQVAQHFARADLMPIQDDQRACLSDASRHDEAQGMILDWQDRCGLPRHVALGLQACVSLNAQEERRDPEEGESWEAAKSCVYALVATLAAHEPAYTPVKVHDGEDYHKVTEVAGIVDVIGSVDDYPTIHFAPATNEKDWGKRGVLVIASNGWDTISDYHCGDAAFDAAVQAAQEFSDELRAKAEGAVA